MIRIIPLQPHGPGAPIVPSTPTPDPVGPDNAGDDQSATGLPSRQPKYTADKIPQENAGYQGPEQGPFKCANCEFFDPTDSDCHVVAGKVDPEGCCNNFVKAGAAPSDGDKPDDNDEDDDDEGSPDESAESIS